MKLTSREALLLALAPALLAPALYFGCARPSQEERVVLARSRTDRASARLGDDAERARELERLQQELRSLAEEEGELRERERALERRWSDPARRLETVRRLGDALRAHGVRVHRSTPAEEDELSLAPGARELARAMHARTGVAPAPWRIDGSSSFAELRSALRALHEADPGLFLMPLALSLHARADSTRLETTLWVWI